MTLVPGNVPCIESKQCEWSSTSVIYNMMKISFIVYVLTAQGTAFL